MALRKNVNPRSVVNNDTGFGVDPKSYGGRFLNRDGSFNVIRKGMLFQYRISIFQKLINMSVWKFVGTIFILFVLVNLLFAALYFIPAIDEFSGLNEKENSLDHFVHLFFFSAQTLTTVGYGYISPSGFWASLISSFEALCGLMSFAIMTGLVYSRFARPKSYLLFSENAVISPYKGKTGLMFRLVNYKDKHTLIDANIKVNLGLTVNENGKSQFKFFALHLERYRIDALSMNWTVVHPIDENSPIQNFSMEDLQRSEAELYVQITGFDDVFCSTVVQKTSYYFTEIIFGAKFKPMYYESDDNKTTYLELNKLNDWERVPL